VCADAAPVSAAYKATAAITPRFIVSVPACLPDDPCRFRRGQPHGAVKRRSAMSEDITFDKSFDLVPGRAEEVLPGVRRIVADNPGPFTFKGTLTYILGRGKVAIIDPGPEDENHARAVLDAVRGETVTHIFVTHTHRDHSPATPAIKAATGATV